LTGAFFGLTTKPLGEEKMVRILLYKEEAFMPESMLPDEALNWCRYMVGTEQMRIDSWQSKTKVTFWRTGEYSFYKFN
jgi:hypothetical protein